MTDADGPLVGIRVLDLSRVLAGPVATQLLGDLGADVVKVERPGAGDDTRAWGPPYLKDADGQDSSESAYFLSCNRNKRSLTIDLGKEKGQALVRELAARADVLIENFKVGDMARFGLAYTDLAPSLPRLVYCSISGFGQTGPYAAQPGYDFMVQGMGGVMSITGQREGEPGGEPEGEPMKVGVAVADVVCGLYAAVAILAALRHRDESGQGQHIDLGLLDTQVAWLVNQGMNYLVSGTPPRRLGNAHPNIVPYQVFAASDGYVIIAVGNDGQFRRLAACVGMPASGRRGGLRHQRRPGAQPGAAGPDPGGLGAGEDARPLARGPHRGGASPAAPSTTSARCSPTRRCFPAACASPCRIQRRAAATWT